MTAERRTGIGYDCHRFGDGGRLILGGVEIPGERGLEGHSDADAVAHAVADALLGAAGLGDIGDLFGDDDERYRDADSLELLAKVVSLLSEPGWRVSNVDVTVVAERPKLGSLKAQMAERLAQTLAVGAANVNVKAKTGERLGFVGREEGIAALAVAQIERES